MPTLKTPLNQLATTLGSAHAASSGTLVLAAGYGAVILAEIAAEGAPSISSGAPIRVSVIAAAEAGDSPIPAANRTIFVATGLSTDTLTGCTAIEGTTDRNYAIGDVVRFNLTAGTIADIHATIAGLGSVYDELGAAAAAQTAAEAFGETFTIGQVTGALATAESFTGSSLASYVGSTTIVTVGTIAAGTWAGTAVAIAHGGTGATSAGAALTALGAQAGPLTGDVTTSGAAATVTALQGRNVSTTAPTDTYVLTWVSSTSKWTPVAASGGGIAIGATAVSGGTAGAILFVDSGGTVVQDSANLTWDDTTGSLYLNRTGVSYLQSAGDLNLYANSGNIHFLSNTVQAFTVTAFGSTFTAYSAADTPLAVQGQPSQTAPLSVLRQISSTSTARTVAINDGQFNSAVDASFTGAAVLDAVSHAGTEHGLRIDSTGSGANAAWFDSSAPNYQTMVGGHFIANCTSAPTGNPTGGGFFYVLSGALMYRGSSGTVTTIAPA